MHKDCIRFGQSHHSIIHLIAGKCFFTDFFFCFLTHTSPCIGINYIYTFYRFFWIMHHCYAAAGFCSIALGQCYDFRVWHISIRASNGYIHPYFGTANHQRMGHVVAIAYICKFDAFQFAFVLLNGNQVCNNLCWMIIIGQTVNYRNICILSQFFYICMAIGTNHNAIQITRQYTRCIFNWLTTTNLQIVGA